MSVTDERAWNPALWNLYGAASISGENVNEYNALTNTAVWNAVTLISGTIGSLPLHLMQKKGETKRLADDRILYRVMHDAWNPYMTAMAGRETCMAHVLTWGNGYAEKVFDGYGNVKELWPISPNRIKPEMHGGQLVYVIRVDNQDVILPRDRILHIPGLGFDGFQGYSVISMASKAIGLGMALETFGANYFGQGTHPGIVVTHPQQLSPAASQRLEKSLTEEYSGLGKAHRLMLLEEGMKLEKLGIPPNDSQFLESRQFEITEVARIFNIPVHKLKEMSKSSFNNIESEQRSFYADTLLPWLVRLEQNYNMQLLSASDKTLSGYGRLYFKHSAEGILRPDAQARADFYAKMFNIGAFSVNDIRGLEDLDPIPGGNEHFVPLNMVPLSMAKEQFNKQLEQSIPKSPKQLPEKTGKPGDETEGGDQDEEVV